MHIEVGRPSAQEVDLALSESAELGLENQITEMDMSFQGPSSSELPDGEPERLVQQGERFEALFRVFLGRAEVTGVTFWGVSDAHTWRNAGRSPASADLPLLFDARQQPKPAYWGVVNAAR